MTTTTTAELIEVCQAIKVLRAELAELRELVDDVAGWAVEANVRSRRIDRDVFGDDHPEDREARIAEIEWELRVLEGDDTDESEDEPTVA